MSNVELSDAEMRAAIAAAPVLKGFSGMPERMGGLTNRVYRLGKYCLRLPGAGTEEYIDRANEAVAAREAARAGVSPAVIAADPASGIMVTEFIDGAVTMSPGAFRERTRAAGVLGEDPVHRAQRFLRARGEVSEVSDRGAYEVERGHPGR